MKNLNIYSVVTLLILSVGIYWLAPASQSGNSPRSTQPKDIPVKVQAIPELSVRETTQKIPVAGQFTTEEVVTLSFKTGGIVQSISVDEGEAVEKGERLAMLDLTEVETQLKQAQLNLKKAQRDHQRISNLYADSVATKEQLLDSKTSLNLAQEALKLAQFNRRHSEIVAPEDGYVLQKMSSDGQMVSPGAPILKMNGASSDDWYLRAGVSDQEWSVINTGDKAAITIGTNTQQMWAGIVIRKSQGVNTNSNSLWVDISFIGRIPPNTIANGLFGEAIITTSMAKASQNNSWAIPYSALLDGHGNSGYVFVTNDRKTVEKVKVSISDIQQDSVLISKGLQDYPELVVAGSAYLTDESSIQITE